MIDLTPANLAVVQRILADYVPDCEVRVFGSRVSGAAKTYSDLDLAIVAVNPLHQGTLRLLKEAFEESELPIRVDVIDMREASESFRQVIERRYEVLQKGR